MEAKSKAPLLSGTPAAQPQQAPPGASSSMSPGEMLAIREAGHWSTRGLARLLGRTESTIGKYERGERVIPEDVAAWLRDFSEWQKSHPAPAKRR